MSTTAKSIQKHITLGAVSFLLGASMLGTTAYATAQEPAKSSTDAASFSEGYTVSIEAANTQGRSANNNKLGSFHHQTQDRPQIWISDIGTLLFDDFDGDGYHSGFSLTIDVDSEFGDTDVYAKIYLEPSDSPSELLHTTGQFSVYGTTESDEYRIDTELRNNYIPDNYSLSIDIHDAWNDQLLDTANERGFSNLRQLPLESGEMDEYEEDLSQHSFDENHQPEDEGSVDVVVTEYAGLFHPALLLVLVGGLFIRRRMH